MTSVARRGLWISASVVGLVLSAGISIGAARHELSGKEDAVAHNADIVGLQSSMRDVRDTIRADQSHHELQAVRDSAFRADILRRLDEINCRVRHQGGC